MNVIYYNEGKHECFDASLASVKKNSPSATIHVLDAADYVGNTAWFDQAYVHRSSNPAYFEKACMRRWLVINEYVRTNGIDQFLVMDWDILCFCDFGKELARFSGYDFTYQNRISIGFSLWNNREALVSLCDLIRTIYCDRDSDVSRKVLSGYVEGQDGGVCDMSVAVELIESGKYKTIDTYQVIDGACFDNNMAITDGWAAKPIFAGKLIKDVSFRDGRAYCTYLGSECRMCVLHFAGHARNEIQNHWERSGL